MKTLAGIGALAAGLLSATIAAETTASAQSTGAFVGDFSAAVDYLGRNALIDRDRMNLIPWDKLTAFFTQHLAERARNLAGPAAR
jgi:hypothetical protein